MRRPLREAAGVEHGHVNQELLTDQVGPRPGLRMARTGRWAESPVQPGASKGEAAPPSRPQLHAVSTSSGAGLREAGKPESGNVLCCPLG